MDEFERGLLTGAGLALLIFIVFFVQFRLDKRRHGRVNAKWFAQRRDDVGSE